MSLTDMDIESAFLWLLGRKPETAAIEWHAQNFGDADSLRGHLMNCQEFLDFLASNISNREDTTFSFLRPKLAFLHLPKTGGTSLTRMLDHAFADEDIFPDRYMIGRYPASYLSRYSLFRGHFSRQELSLIPGPLQILTVLREPRSRLVSQYRFHHSRVRKDATLGVDFLLEAAESTFVDYLKNPLVRSHPGVANSMAWNLFCLDGAIPSALRQQAAGELQSGQISKSTLTEIACAALQAMTWFSTTEDLSDAVHSLPRLLGRQFDLQIVEEREMVTDQLSVQDPLRFRPSPPVQITDEANMLMDDLVDVDEAIYMRAKRMIREKGFLQSAA